MDFDNIYIFAFIVIVIVFFGYLFIENQKINKREIADKIAKEKLAKEKEYATKLAKEKEQKKQVLLDFYKDKLDDFNEAILNFSKYIVFEKGYFTKSCLQAWFENSKHLNLAITSNPIENSNLPILFANPLLKFQDFFINADNYRNNFNAQFIGKELIDYTDFFDNIEGHKLDLQQRSAIVTDEDNNLIIAGAGSGKTTTIVGKVNYIINRYNVDPANILLISFTNKSASNLAARISTEGLIARTFHKFGIDIITNVEGKKPNIFDEAQFSLLIKRYFNEFIEDENYLHKVTEYFTDYLKPEKTQFDFENQGDYIQFLKDYNFKSYKQIPVPVKGKVTLRREAVKSMEECKIANFLLFNSIDYKYEFRYEYDTADNEYHQYKPDFTIFQNGKKIYIEHFGVSRNGEVPPFFAKNGQSYQHAKERYWEKISWAKNLHITHQTVMIETYSYEMSEGVLFENLTTKLQDNGIVLKPKSIIEIWEIINNVAKDEVLNFISLFGTFITLMKSNNYSINDLEIKNRETGDDFFRERNALFIDIIKPIYERYQRHLIKWNEIDFNDMINKAYDYIINGYYNKTFSYIIIDEFQDISINRYRLINAIRQKNPSCKTFCVGDDWQSIYRFSGSDIALFKEFENYFGYTHKSKIETTYRFNNPLISLSSDFIQKNPNQTQKELMGLSDINKTNYIIKYSDNINQDDTLSLEEIFKELISVYDNIEEKEILILSRYKDDLKRRVINTPSLFQIDINNDIVKYKFKTLDGTIKIIKAQFLTVHKAKGLEADIVIILNCNSGKYGFPSEMSDDVVLNLLLSEADQFQNGEERRLFYVAMTRAKEMVYFLSDSAFKSKFITELEVESGNSSNEKCPYCITADVVLKKQGTSKNGDKFFFYGCTNYLYGCDYSDTIWENKEEEI